VDLEHRVVVLDFTAAKQALERVLKETEIELSNQSPQTTPVSAPR
jgi:hypothetical protein